MYLSVFRVAVAKEDVISLRIKLEATRFSLDEQRALLAEKQSQAEILESAVVSGDERIDMCRMEIDNMKATEAEIKDKIQAIFITCQSRKGNGDDVALSGLEGVDVEAIYRRVMGRATASSEEGQQRDGGNVGETKDAATSSFSVRPYAYEISECMERKLALLADAEAEYRNAVATSREKDREKSKLQDTVQQGFELAHQCKSMLIALAKEADGLMVQRSQAEATLRECEKALETAVDRVDETVRDQHCRL